MTNNYFNLNPKVIKKSLAKILFNFLVLNPGHKSML